MKNTAILQWSGQPRKDGATDTNAYEQGAFEANIAQEEARLNGTPDYTMMPPDRQGGFIKIFEARGGNAPQGADGGAPQLEQIDGDGAMISEEGIVRGTLKDGRLYGEGEEILPDGTWRGGYYEAGQMQGAGFWRSGPPMMAKCIFSKAISSTTCPIKQVEVTYEDGSSQINLWRGRGGDRGRPACRRE